MTANTCTSYRRPGKNWLMLASVTAKSVVAHF